MIHTQEKQYICQHCGKTFALIKYLKEHTYTHTKDKPYVCGVGGCEKKFRQAGKLSLHRRTHKEYSLKQYKCHASVSESIERKEFQYNIDNLQLEIDIKKDTYRNFARQDSGKTTATLNKEVDIIFTNINSEGLNIPKMFDENNIEYIEYLELLCNSLVKNIRPILPPPIAIDPRIQMCMEVACKGNVNA